VFIIIVLSCVSRSARLCRLQLIWTLSDDSDEVCERIITTGFHEDMLSNLSWDALSVDRVKESQSRRKICVVEAHINTLHNVVRRVHAARAVFRQCRAVDVVHKFRDLNEHPVIFTARRCASAVQAIFMYLSVGSSVRGTSKFCQNG